MTDYLIAVGCGIVFGILFYALAVYQVKVRAQFTDEATVKKFKNVKLALAWVAISTGFNVLMVALGCDPWYRLKFGLFVLMAINISAVDITLRRIPNALLLGIILLKIADIVVGHVVYEKFWFDTTFEAVIVLFGVYILCTLPAIVGITMGAGDIKYCSVLGFAFGFTGFAEAMFVMSVLLILYWVYLKRTKTGDMKTAAPMGPFLSAGALLPIILGAIL